MELNNKAKPKKLSILNWRFQIQKRDTVLNWVNTVSPFAAVIIAVLVGGLLPILLGKNPAEVYSSMISGIAISRVGFSEILVRFSPLLLTGLAVALPLNAGFFNIGANGQFHLGAIVAFWVATQLPELPSYLIIPILMVAGFAGGAAWGFVPALMKTRFKISEVVSTLLFDYLGIFLLFHLIHGPWRKKDFYYPETLPIPDAAMLPRIPGTRAHLGVVFGILAAVIIYIILKKTIFGYELKMIGANPDAARASGIRVNRNIIFAMLIAGGLAGLGGMAELSGIVRRLKAEISLNYGYIAISIALLARLDPLRTILSALILSILFISGLSVQRSLQLPFSLIEIIIGLVVILLLIGRFMSEHRIVLERKL